MQNKIEIYQSQVNEIRLQVKLNRDTVWLNRQQLSILFDRDIKTIGKHINNVFKEGEVDKESTVEDFAIVQNEGKRQVERQIEHFNLDVIISVGYRVKSQQGTCFRIWATKRLKESKAAHLLYFLVKNHPFTDGNKRCAAYLFVDLLT
jgi:hypothetical protein